MLNLAPAQRSSPSMSAARLNDSHACDRPQAIHTAIAASPLELEFIDADGSLLQRSHDAGNTFVGPGGVDPAQHTHQLMAGIDPSDG